MLDDATLDRSGPLGRLSFLFALWVSLATAVLCAVVPGGLPLSRGVGSAFDPSTTIVALRSEETIAGDSAILRSDDGDEEPAGFDFPFQANALLGQSLPAIVAARGLGPIVAHTPLRPRAIDRALYARPPPIR